MHCVAEVEGYDVLQYEQCGSALFLTLSGHSYDERWVLMLWINPKQFLIPAVAQERVWSLVSLNPVFPAGWSRWADSLLFIRSSVSQHALGHRVTRGSAAVFERVDLWSVDLYLRWFMPACCGCCFRCFASKPWISCIQSSHHLLTEDSSSDFLQTPADLSRICRDLLKL